MAESSSPEVPKQRKKPLLPASPLHDSSSPAPVRKFKIKRIVSPAVRAQKKPVATDPKGKTKRGGFLKSKLFDHQCTEKGKSDGSESNSSDDGDKSDLSYVSPGQNHPDAEKHEYLAGLGSQSDMPPPLQATRFEDRSPLADRIQKRVLAEKAARRALRIAELEKVRLAAEARRLGLGFSSLLSAAVADVPAPSMTTSPDDAVATTHPPVTTLPEAAVADLPPPPVIPLPAAAVADLPPPPLSVVHEVVDVSSKSPLRHPFFGSSTGRGSGVKGVSSNSAITFSAVRVADAEFTQLRSPSMTSSMQPENPRNPRLKLKPSLDPSKRHPSAAPCPPSHLAYPPPKPKEATTVTEPKTPSKTPSKLIPVDEMVHSPCRSVKSSADKSSILSRLNLDSSPVPSKSKKIICLSQELELLAVDDSPVSKLEALKALMASNPGFYGFSTGTQMDRVQQHSRETQTSPMRTSGLTVEDLRDELGQANRALLKAFGF